jgi:hypothetical protein
MKKMILLAILVLAVPLMAYAMSLPPSRTYDEKVALTKDYMKKFQMVGYSDWNEGGPLIIRAEKVTSVSTKERQDIEVELDKYISKRANSYNRACRQEVIDHFKKHPDRKRFWPTINNGDLAIGMTSQEAVFSIGEPYEKNRTVTSYGIHEQWVYGNRSYYSYVYFENDTLISWQESH